MSDQAFLAGGLHENQHEMTYGGALSFLRRKYTRDLNGVDVAVSGVPFDNAVTYRPGCRLGPRAIRAASVQLQELKSFPYGIDFGGDHFVAYPLIRAVAAKHGPVALLQFDAHCDTWSGDGSEIDHGTMFGKAVSEGIVDTSKSTQIGLRTYNDSDYGFEILTAPWVHKNGVDAALEIIRARVGEALLYVSFDVDCLDPAFAPGTGTPVAGGLASWQALELMRGLKGLNLVGMDVVEVSPPFDHAEMRRDVYTMGKRQ